MFFIEQSGMMNKQSARRVTLNFNGEISSVVMFTP